MVRSDGGVMFPPPVELGCTVRRRKVVSCLARPDVAREGVIMGEVTANELAWTEGNRCGVVKPPTVRVMGLRVMDGWMDAPWPDLM